MNTTLEKTLQRSNQISNYMETEVQTLPEAILKKKPAAKKWSIIEVVSHLNQVYARYLENFDRAIEQAEPNRSEEEQPEKRSLLGRLAIYTNRPKGKKRKFKMKTFDFFEPSENSIAHNETLDLFFKNKEAFNQLIKKARKRKVNGIKMPTALGEKMRFYVPECFEFVTAHEERHIVQIQELVEAFKPAAKAS